MDAVEEVRALGHGECELWRRWGRLADGGKRARATWMIGWGARGTRATWTRLVEYPRGGLLLLDLHLICEVADREQRGPLDPVR